MATHSLPRRLLTNLVHDKARLLNIIPTERPRPPLTLSPQCQPAVRAWLEQQHRASWGGRDADLDCRALADHLCRRCHWPPEKLDTATEADVLNALESPTTALELATTAPVSGDGETPELTGEAKALGLLVAHPTWTDKKIAKATGVNRTTLYTWEKFKGARAMLRFGEGQYTTDGKKCIRKSETVKAIRAQERAR
ncbi:MAG: hypothetical protein V2A79_19755 [Planctomycetota bacterium]